MHFVSRLGNGKTLLDYNMKLLRSQYLLTIVTGLFLVLPYTAFANITGTGLEAAAQELIYKIVMGILGMFVWLAALLLNFAVNNFIIGFGNTFSATGVGVAVDNVWVIVRDFVNLTFIFGFVYIGFKMILNSSDSNTRRWLVNIILAALLVNFSLFMVKFAVDISNQLAAQIAVNGLGSTCTYEGCVTKDGLQQVDLASEFMARMGLSKVYSLDFNAVNGAGWGYIFGSAMLSLTAMFVFAAGGLLIIMRFAVLCLFMVLSPVMFIGWILPPLKDTFERFWSMFVGRALFAPIYLLFIYFSLQIISGLQISVGNGGNGFGNPDWAGTFQGAGKLDANGNAMLTLGTFPFFILAAFFMAASVVIANKLGADGGTKAVGLGKAFGNRVRGYTTRGVSKPFRMAGGGATRLAGAGAANLEGRLNQRLGSLSQGGAWSQRAARALDRTAGAGLRNAQNASVGGGESYNARNTRVQQQNVRLNDMDSARKREEDREKAEEKLAAEEANVLAVNSNAASTVQQKKDAEEARKAAEAAMAAAIKEMTDAELVDMAGSEKGRAKLASAAYAKHLSDAQIKAIKESGTYRNTDTKDLKASRETATFDSIEKVLKDTTSTATQLNDTFEELGKTVKSLSEDRLQNMKVERLTDESFASHLSDTQVESLQKSGKFTSQQMQQIKDARSKGIAGRIDGTILPNNPNATSATFKDKQREKILSGSAQDVGKLPVDVFKNTDMAPLLTPAMVEQRMKNGISKADLQAIKSNVENHIKNSATSASSKKMWTKWQDNTTYGAQFFNA